MIKYQLKIYFLLLLGLLTCYSVMANESDTESESTETKRVYPKKTQLDFEGAQIEGELKNPSEFYFQHRPEEKFDSLIQRRKNFHREMMRDVILSQ